ncbi:hypothetical protein ACU61A_40835 [Pseudonocardia sichuanensis]
MTSSTTVAHPGPRPAPAASPAAGRRRGVGRALGDLLSIVLNAARAAARLGRRRRPSPARLVYDVMLEACEAALDQLAAAPDPGERELALLQLQAAHEAAALLASEIPADDPDAGDLGPVGGRDVGMWQVHRVTAQLCAHLATTERRLLHPAPAPAGRRGALTPLEWARPLSELTVASSPAERARLVLTLGLLIDDGGRVTDQMHRIAMAYLHLAGTPEAITGLYDQIAGADFGLVPVVLDRGIG